MSEDVSYSRHTAVAAIRSFYEFLTTIPGLLPSAIKEPPATGWSDIDSTTLKNLKKNDAVVDLLRHLPYINNNENGTVEIAYKTTVLRYNGPGEKMYLESGKLEGTLVPVDCGELPDYVAVLTEGGRYGSWLLLDTLAGTITDYIMLERPEREEPPLGHPDHWRAYQTLPIPEFFELWKNNYRSLEWVVVPERADMDGVLIRHDQETNEVREIYRAHGWPGSFRFQECKEALLEWERRRKEEFLNSGD